MAYSIVMPQLSDSMSEGKLISWKVKEGDRVKVGDVIAEVESDKAIMEVQSFKSGIVKELKITEGSTAPVGSVIAIIEESNTTHTADKIETKAPKAEPKKQDIEESKETNIKEPKKAPKEHTQEFKSVNEIVEGYASPRAKALASRLKLDIKSLQNRGKLPKPAHYADIEALHTKRYFTPKALRLLQDYNLSPTLFSADKKYRYDTVMEYIIEHKIPKIETIDSIQKAVINTVERATQKPVYHIYDSISSGMLNNHITQRYTITVWLVKLISEMMMQNELFRARLSQDKIQIFPTASISIAVSHGKRLYMPVIKDANLKSIDEIADELIAIKDRVINNRITKEDLEGSTFGISNLGMVGIERFDAMINGDDSGIIAIGSAIDGKIAVTMTLDHRIINGWQGAEAMMSLKELSQDEKFFEKYTK